MNGIQGRQKLEYARSAKAHILTSRKKLTQKRVRELFDYLPSGFLVRKARTAMCTKAGDIIGVNGNGYVHVGVDGVNYKAHRVIWLWHYGCFPKQGIDHINRNPNDNRIENLRQANQSCNLINTGNRIDNTSGVKGVWWYQRYNKWHVYIRINGKHKHLGYYQDFDEAVCYRLAAEQCFGWEEYDQCSPAFQYIKNNFNFINVATEKATDTFVVNTAAKKKRKTSNRKKLLPDGTVIGLLKKFRKEWL